MVADHVVEAIGVEVLLDKEQGEALHIAHFCK
jgi:hypothetical protein